MKHLKKLIAAALTMFVAFAVSTVALAAGETATNTITVNNAAKGETYAVYKIFDATENGKGGINYVGEIPSEFEGLLEPKTIGQAPNNTYSSIGVVDGVTEAQLQTAAKNYIVRLSGAESYDALIASKTFTGRTGNQIVASGNSVVFDVDPGYYIVASTQGTAVMIDSTTPNAAVNEKNSKTITANKTVDKTSYSIGDTITYTATFDTTNYYGTGDSAKVVSSYEISDTLPEFLSDVKVTKITIGGADYPPAAEGEEYAAPQFDNKKIVIPWATKSETTDEVTGETTTTWTSLYNNGSQIVVTYTAKLTDVTNINAADTNTVKIQPVLGDGTGEHDKPWDDRWQDDAEITTYAAALKKVDAENKPLAGAIFSVKGLQVAGTANDEGVYTGGVYTVVSYDPTSDATVKLATDADGKLYIVGLASDVHLTVTEYQAPDGYNKLTTQLTLDPQVLEHAVYHEEGTIYYDAKGNVVSETSTASSHKDVKKNLSDLDTAALSVVNNQGTELPSTGGIGTTIFYIVGGIMVVAAGVLLVTKKRVSNN